MDTWGQYLIACSSKDGKIYEWQLNTAAKAAAITNAPVGNGAIVVTEERFLFALGAGGNLSALEGTYMELDAKFSYALGEQTTYTADLGYGSPSVEVGGTDQDLDSIMVLRHAINLKF